MKTTESPAPVSVTKVDLPAGRGRPKPKSEGRALNAFSHGILVVWAVMVVMPLLWAVMTSFKDDRSIFSSPWSLPDRLPSVDFHGALADLGQLSFASPQLLWRLVTASALAQRRIFGLIDRFGVGQQGPDLLGENPFRLTHPRVAHHLAS